MKWLLSIALAVGLLFGTDLAMAAKTTGGVNWLDSRVYIKPYFVPLNIPPATNEYWIDLSSGSGSTCSMASPCANFSALSGKAGINGGPAVIHVKGTGNGDIRGTFNGSGDVDCRVSTCNNWIYITTWPAGSTNCATECTGTFSTNSNIQDSGVHHIIIDGGPNLKLKFDGHTNQGYALHVRSNYITVYRTQSSCSLSNAELLHDVASFVSIHHVSYINNEMFGCLTTGDQASALYLGPGSPTSDVSNVVIQNNLIRDMGGECIEVNPRTPQNDIKIVGNAFNNCGWVTCGSAWGCRGAVVLSDSNGGNSSNVVIASNLMWNFGGGCIWDNSSGSPVPLIYNNTCYIYGAGTGTNNRPEGINGNSDNATGTVRNNIIYSPSSIDPFDSSSQTKTNNLCASGKSCGTSSQVWTTAGASGTVLSTTENNIDFLVPSYSSVARNHGFDVSATWTTDYRGNPLKSNTGQTAIGAIRYAPVTPTFGRQ